VLVAPAAADVEEAAVVEAEETIVRSVVGTAEDETIPTGAELLVTAAEVVTAEDEATTADVVTTETVTDEFEEPDEDSDPPTVKSTQDS
jgi:hypothetical protein